MSEHTLEYFLNKGTIKRKDAADIEWYHAVNSKSKLIEALRGEYAFQSMKKHLLSSCTTLPLGFSHVNVLSSLSNNTCYVHVFSLLPLLFIEVLHR